MAFTVATRTGTNVTDSTSQVITLPDGSNVSGRLVIVILGVDGTGGATWPAGWTELFDTQNTETTLAAVYRFIDGTEGFDGTDDTITATTASEQSSQHAYLISAGHHASTPPEAASAAPATPDPPNLDPTGWASEAALWIAAAAARFSANFTAAPTNYTNLLTSNSGTPSPDFNAPLGTARRELTASAEDPGAFTETENTVFVTATIAVRPTGAPPPPTPNLFVVRSNLQLR